MQEIKVYFLKFKTFKSKFHRPLMRWNLLSHK